LAKDALKGAMEGSERLEAGFIGYFAHAEPAIA
jgi:hypothetical protein